jgi:NAD(P)-dependent dehydrogenase (short-subunit alcohol dehydrogenase family)
VIATDLTRPHETVEKIGHTGMSHYIATKMGIIEFMCGLANDVASDRITANAVLPGSRTHWPPHFNRKSKNAPPGNSQPSSGWENPRMLLERLHS